MIKVKIQILVKLKTCTTAKVMDGVEEDTEMLNREECMGIIPIAPVETTDKGETRLLPPKEEPTLGVKMANLWLVVSANPFTILHVIAQKTRDFSVLMQTFL